MTYSKARAIALTCLPAMNSFILSPMAITRCQRSPLVVEAVSWELEDADFPMGKKPFGQLVLLHCLQTNVEQDLPGLRTVELPLNHIHEPLMPQLHRPIWILLLTPTTVSLLALIAGGGFPEEMTAKNEAMVSDPETTGRHSTETFLRG